MIMWAKIGDNWVKIDDQVSEGLYSDSTRGIYLLCLILQVLTITILNRDGGDGDDGGDGGGDDCDGGDGDDDDGVKQARRAAN